jgi:hypothetical protein
MSVSPGTRTRGLLLRPSTASDRDAEVAVVATTAAPSGGSPDGISGSLAAAQTAIALRDAAAVQDVMYISPDGGTTWTNVLRRLVEHRHVQPERVQVLDHLEANETAAKDHGAQRRRAGREDDLALGQAGDFGDAPADMQAADLADGQRFLRESGRGEQRKRCDERAFHAAGSSRSEGGTARRCEQVAT